MAKRFLIPFIMGSELRQFSHSGLIQSLLDEGWQVTVAAKIVDEDLREQLDSRVSLISLPPMLLSFWPNQLSIILDKAKQSSWQRKGQAGWFYQQAAAAKNLRQKLLFGAQNLLASFFSLHPSLYALGERLEQWLLSQEALPEWSKLLDEQKPDVLLVNIPRSAGLSAVLNKAKGRGAKTMLSYHTWKDTLVAAARLNHDFDRVGVWNPSMREQALFQNPNFETSKLAILGCGHFECVGREDWLLPEAELRSRLGLAPNSRIILFTASAPWVVPDEEKYIALLHEAILRGDLPSDVEILLRSNPMDKAETLGEVLAAISPQIRFMKVDWRWEKQSNWGFQRHEDTILYNSLLHYASLNLSVPSTVTVEAAIADLPVVNIGFTLENMQKPMTGDILSFWDADFYRHVKETEAADLSKTGEEMIRMIQAALENPDSKSPNRKKLVAELLGTALHQSTKSSVQLIKSLSD